MFQSNTKESIVTEPKSFAALRHPGGRAYLSYAMLAMMADNIEHVISYWVIYDLFRWEELQGFAVISHWSPFLLLSWYVGLLSDRFACRSADRLNGTGGEGMESNHPRNLRHATRF